MTPEQKRAACPLISTSPQSICSAAVAGYRAELRQVLDAEAIYLGVSK